MTELPSINENPNKTQGRNGALNVNKPKKFILIKGFRRLHMYTSMMVNACPRNTRFTNKAIIYNLLRGMQ